MDSLEYELSEKDITKKGNLIIFRYENEVEYYIPGEYELKLPIVNDVSKMVELNGEKYIRINIPSQKEIINLHYKILEKIENEKWFNDINSSQYEFSKFEEIIGKSLTNFNLDENTKIGLIGELYLLNTIFSLVTKKEKYEEIINGWHGFKSKSRDFIYDKKCIEVKTTTKERSIHNISNLNQVDSIDDDGGKTELYLASIGVSRNDSGNTSISALVESILSFIDDDYLKSRILENISNYGTQNIGYNHLRMKGWSQFQNRYDIIFERYYYMNDPNIRVLRFSDIAGMTSMIEKSIKYQIELKNKIDGSTNNPILAIELIKLIFD